MKKGFLTTSKIISLFVWIFLLGFSLQTHAQATHQALVLKINGAIGPATADYVERGLLTAEKNNASLVIVEIDTPGGLDKSMRAIIKAILVSPIPVISYVYPSGARAASAGTYILYASHIAAMAPGTNLGAATPVNIGGSDSPSASDDKKQNSSEKSTLEKKVQNDAIAYIKSLAELRGRNAEWAQKAITESASLPANEALKLKVIDIISPSLENLLQQVNGKTVMINNTPIKLNTSELTLEQYFPDWRTRFLETITDPTIAYILLLIAIYGLFFEFANPGYVLPGVTGAIALLLALYAFHLLPINYVGLGLILLGIAFMVAEAFVASFGTLGIGGIIAFIFGSILLLDSGFPGFGIPLYLIIIMTILNGLFFFFVLGFALKARNRPIVTGAEGLIGNVLIVNEEYMKNKTLLIHGEHWKIESVEPLRSGDKVIVTGIRDLTLYVKIFKE